MRSPGIVKASLVACLLSVGPGTGTAPAPDAPAKYHNARWGFSVNYPLGWNVNEGFNMAGAKFSPPGSGGVLAEIGVGALPNQPKALDSDEPLTAVDVSNLRTLNDVVREDLKALRDPLTSDSPARDVRVISEQKVKFAELLAIRVEISYVRHGRAQFEEWIEFIKDTAVYRLDLSCALKSRSEYQPFFKRVADTFRFDRK
jgi:hypothetical protein